MKRHILKGLISALLALFGFSVFAGVAQATTYYVSPTGNDTAAGTSVTTPWKTFDRSWQSLYPGDTLIVMDGVYYQSLNPDTRNGEPGKPITIRAQHDGKAIIDGEHVRMTVKIGDTWPGPIGEYFVVEGIVARNSSDSVWFLRGDHNVLRRVSGYNASTDTNDHVFLVWANDNLIEDCLASGTGRNMMLIYQGQRNTFRRCVAAWTQWDGRDFCGVTWPNGNNLVIYNASNNLVENTISFGRSVGRGLLIQANDDSVQAVGNRVLGAMVAATGMNWDGTEHEFGTTRPGPTTCEGYTDYHAWSDLRMGAGFYGQGLISGNVFEDLFSTGNAGLGFSAAKPFGVGVTDGVIDHATIFGNGLDAPVVDGGIGAEVNDDQLDPFTITNTYIEGTSYQGQGARLQNRYVDGVLTATSLWPWPMESRALDELGISITDLMVNRYRVLAPPNNGVTPTPATSTPTKTPVPATSTPTRTPVPATSTPTRTPVPATSTPTRTPVPATSTPTKTPVPPTSAPTYTPVATPQVASYRVNVPLLPVNSGNPALDAGNRAIVWLGKVSTGSNYADIRLVGSLDGLHIRAQMMDETVQAGDVLTFTVKGVALVARYPATNGWTIAMRCGTTCRGWDATTVIPWSTFGGMPQAGATWTLSVKLTDVDGALTPTASTWPPAGAGSLYWGEPDYRGATIAGMQQLNLPLSGDSMLGGATDCGAPDYPNYFPTWGQRNWGTSPYVNVQAQWDTADWPCYSKYYAQWSLAGLPAGAQIVSATLEMRQFGNAGYEPGDTGATVFQVFEVKSAWNESTVSWDSAPIPTENLGRVPLYQVPENCEIPNFFCNPGLPVTFDVTEIVRRAASENRTWASVGLYTAAGQYHSGKYLYSREGTEPPVIHISYVTGAPPTATPTKTPAPPTATPTKTPVPPTATPTKTPTPLTATPTKTPTPVPVPSVPFPTTLVLDNFNRANGVVGTNWSGNTSGYLVAGNKLDIGKTYDIYWKPTSYGVDQEAFVTLSKVDSLSDEMGVILKGQSSTGIGSGILEVEYNPREHKIIVWSYCLTSGWRRLGTDLPITFVDGDQLGARAWSTGRLEVYKNKVRVGVWDITSWPYFNRKGYIGIYTQNAWNGLMDDFGGGTVVAAAMSPGPNGMALEPVDDIGIRVGSLSVAGGELPYLLTSNSQIALWGGYSWQQYLGSMSDGVAADYAGYLDAVVAMNQNLVRLEGWGEQPWMTADAPSPYAAAGVGADGAVLYDLHQFNPAYFALLRQRAIEAKERGVYASIVLFDGNSLTPALWSKHPYNAANNVNQIEGDTDGDGAGAELQTLGSPVIVALQDAYVQQILASVNDLDNVIFEVINQPTAESTAWQLHVAELIRQETDQQAKTHLVGASAFNSDELAALTADLFDFVAPQGGAMDATVTMQGASKVVQLDWSHLQQTDAPGAWVWKMATRGYAPALLFAAPGVQEDGAPNDSRLELAAGFGFFNQLMRRMQANQMAPAPAVCSTGYCLVDDRDAVAAYLVYLPEGGAVTIDLTGNSGQFTAEWISPHSGKTVHLETVDAGLPRNLTAPFEGDALVYLHRALNFGQWVFMPTLGAGEYASLAGPMPAEATVTDRLFLPALEAHP